MEYVIYISEAQAASTSTWTIGTSIASVIIALTAVIFSLLQSRKTDKHNRLMVTPHISSITHVNSEKGITAITLENNGLGPALINDFSIHIDNIAVKGNDIVEESLKRLLKDLPINEWGHESITTNSFLPAGGKIEVVTIVSSKISPEEVIQKLDSRILLQIDYRSIYGDRFTFNSDD